MKTPKEKTWGKYYEVTVPWPAQTIMGKILMTVFGLIKIKKLDDSPQPNQNKIEGKILLLVPT